MRGTKVKFDEVNQILKLGREGFSLGAIANRTKRSIQTVRKYLNKYHPYDKDLTFEALNSFTDTQLLTFGVDKQSIRIGRRKVRYQSF